MKNRKEMEKNEKMMREREKERTMKQRKSAEICLGTNNISLKRPMTY